MSESLPEIKVLLVDDHAMFRTALRLAIESRSRIRVVAEAASRAEALAAVVHVSPDIILLDLDLGGENGMDLLPDLNAIPGDWRVILLTGLRDPNTHRRAIQLGAVGLVLKDNAIETVFKAIEKVYAGEVWLDRTMIAAILRERTLGAGPREYDAEQAKIAQLTTRERQVIRLIGEGRKNKQIAERMSISEATVRHHLTAVFNKLAVSDRLELAIYAYQHQLADLPR